MRHRLDLLGNAVDSLNEGLRRYTEAQGQSPRAYKFAVLHVAHFAELLFKHVVASEHKLLIYKRPDSRALASESTIGLWDAIQILRNAGYTFDETLLKDLEWLKRLRNEIEHYEFEMDIKEVRATLGRVLRATDAFAVTSGLQPLLSSVDKDCRDTYTTLLDEYLQRLTNARTDAAASDAFGRAHHCSFCGEVGVAVEHEDRAECFFCGKSESMRRCVICNEAYRESELAMWNDDHPGEPDLICDNWEDHILGEN